VLDSAGTSQAAEGS